MKNNNTIPKLPYRFFKWYCRKERYEELHGDLEEFFYDRVEEMGLSKARRLYLWDVIRCCQPYAWKDPQSQNSTIMMFRNYYKTSIRNLMKNPLSSLINLIGLSAAIGICVLAYAFIKYSYEVDDFHENGNKVFLVTFFADRDNKVQQNGQSPAPLGSLLKQDFAQIKKVCRVENRNVVMKYYNNVFHERVRYVDPEFLEMFTFPLKWGVPNSLADLNSIILSEDMSIKYFGDANPIGESIQVIFGEQNKKVFEVTGVAKEFPAARSFDFDFLINFENLKTVNPNYNPNDWTDLINATLVQLDDPLSMPLIERKMDKYRALQNEADDDWVISSFALESMATLYRKSGNIRHDIANDSFEVMDKSSISFTIIGLLMLALASINYINISIVSGARRLKEIGLRKVIGANRRMVIIQFLGENLLVMSIALFFGLLLGVTVFIPWMESSGEFRMDFNLFDRDLWIMLPSVLIFTALVSGSYPALYISRFQAATIFKGSFSLGRRGWLTKVFLGFQLTLACILISVAVMFTQNTIYQNNRSWGYDQTGVVYAHLENQAAFEKLYGAMHQHANVLSISGAKHHLGKAHGAIELEAPERKYEVYEMLVDSNYFETIGLSLAEGRAFRDHAKSDDQAIIINETLINHLELAEPIGSLFKIDSVQYEVIGVVNDFHAYNFYSKVRPTIFRVAEPESYRYLSMRAKHESIGNVYEELRSQWAVLFPELPFDGGYQEDVWGSFREDMNFGSQFWRTLASVVLVLAGLGLYGLVTLNVSGRTKEFSIRKVLGAGLSGLTTSIGRQYLTVFVVALVLGIPAGYYLVSFIFNLFFVYHMPLNYSFSTFTVGILVLVLVAVVAAQIKRVSNTNPVDGLKME
ncbi:MAG: ABC transporter permease [Bacteroidota bacterium]